jgi:hypothetical protein
MSDWLFEFVFATEGTEKNAKVRMQNDEEKNEPASSPFLPSASSSVNSVISVAT